MSAPASSILSKKAWASSFVALFLFGSITACAEKPAPTKAANAGDTTTSKPADNRPSDEPANTNLTQQVFQLWLRAKITQKLPNRSPYKLWVCQR